ncbi:MULTISPECIES: hypothetical protein [unclassified Roseateles]|uniref:hypothetical protein n=1 Tax=unclassified Roseateles TaxID=2626991 RepID=UPI000AAA7192|nr:MULTISPECIES: hypothetical protein [unclassified Roseateles]
MARTAGIALVDLFDITDTINSVLPQSVSDFIERFVVVGHQASSSDGAVFHTGSLQAIATAIDEIPTEFNIGIGRLSLPLINTGIPFQLAFQRSAVASGSNLEGSADVWRLDLSLEVFNLIVDFLQPAIYVPETGTTPRHLVRDPSRSEVRITGSAVLRIEQPAGGAPLAVKFIDQPDPLDPAAVSGAVATLSCSPPHFFIGGSEFGLSVGRLTFDFSDSFSPPEIIERNQGPAWTGVAIREATLYAPRNLPGIGDLSGGVKNLLIGSPFGLQGEIEVQFGRTALNPSAFNFVQVTDSGDQPLAISGSGASRIVQIEGSEDQQVTVHAGFVTTAPPDPSVPTGGLVEWDAEWRWAGGAAQTGDASSASVRHGQSLKVTPIETVRVGTDENDFRHPEITFRFVAGGDAPVIGATVGTQNFVNVTHVGGTREALGTVTLTATSGGGSGSRFEWEIVNVPQRSSSASFPIDPTLLVGIQTVILRETVTLAGGQEQVRLARTRLHTLGSGELLVGCEAGVYNAADPTTALALTAVEGTFDLSDFHAEGGLFPTLEQAEIDSADPSLIDVPTDGLAMVTITPAAAPPPPPPATDRHVQVLMDYDLAVELSWGPLAPEGATVSFSQTALLAWAARYPGAKFIVVGRCDDIGTDSYNASLATRRADRGRALLSTLLTGQSGTPVPAASIFSRGEQSQFTGASAAGDTEEENAVPPMRAVELSEAAEGTPANGRLIHADIPASTGWEDKRIDAHEPQRDDFRRIDIYAIGGTAGAGSERPDDNATVGPTLRRSLVPAAGRDPAAVPPGSPAMDYRVKLRIVWDSPTVSQLSDAIPTLAEAEFAWTPQQAPLPAMPGSGDAVELSREVLTVFVNWTHDPRTGYTKAALGIKSEGDPDGLISTTTKPLIAALAFGPALLSGVNADTDLIGSGARIAALIAAVGFSEVDLGGGPLVGDGSKAAITSAAFETEMRSIADPGAAMQVRVVTDYVCTLHINGGVLGIKTAADKPMKIRYKRVGLQYDTAKTGWERFGLVYDTTSMEIEDPGRWQIDGVLGSLLRIVEVAMGRGSVWIEGRIAIALQIGIIEISEAIIRLTFRDGQPLPDFELRGFVLKADIPQVLKGEGRLRIEDGGLIRAGVAAELIPLGLGVEAALAMGMPPEIAPSIFLSLYLGVQFSTPLPLAQSGMAIYGFKGLFVMNGQRKLPANPDPVGRELDWWRTPPEQKYEPHKDQFALGVGVVVGTLPDVSFCVSCAGMVVVAFPDVEVILGVDVNIVEVPDTEVSDEGGASGTITGLIVIDDEAVKLAVSAQYTIPSVLEVKVPFSGFFPYLGTGKKVYVRIGSDGQVAHGRFGEPVTLKLLPGTIDVQAWTYLMIEEGGLPALGGDVRFTFDGFAVGFGAGFEIKWSAGPIKLEASAKVLIGFGTAPLLLKGGIFVRGELDLVVLSISARGELILEARQIGNDIAIRIDGEFCGEVDLFFFSISGCVGVSFDFGPDMTPPVPPSPVKGISLTDRRDHIMGVGATGAPLAAPVVVVPADPSDPAQVAAAAAASAGVAGNNTVWPDTAPVIHFSHYVENAMPAAAQFKPGPTPTQPKWTGSSQLKYAYRLDSVLLKKRSDGTVVAGTKPLQSVWASTPYRQPDASGGANPLPSEHEGPNLKLLDWNPWSWVVNMSNGGAGQPGAPGDTVGTICDPKPLPARACVLGRDARRAGLNKVRLRQQTPAPGPYPSRFFVTGEPVIRAGTAVIRGQSLMTLLGLSGGTLVPGEVVALPFAALEDGESLTRGYRLPALRRAVAGGSLAELPLPWEGLFDQPVTQPSVTLMICDAPGHGRPGGGDDNPGGGDGDGRVCDGFRGVKTRNDVAEVVRQGFRILPLQAKDTLDLVDQLDTAIDPLVPGRDGSAEVRLPERGVAIRFATAVRGVELHLVLFGGPVRARALDATGREIASDTISPPARRAPQVLRLRADGIAVVELVGGSNEALLFKVCVEGGKDGGKTCESFDGLKPADKAFDRIAHRGFVFVPLKKGEPLRLTDAVDQRTLPPRRGNDGDAEIFFPAGGMRVTLPHACAAIELHLMVFTRDGIKAEGLDGNGQAVAGDGGSAPQGEPLVLTLRAKPGEAIAAINIHGGGGEALLYRICCLGGDGAHRCVDFDELDRPARAVARVVHAGIAFEAASGKPELALVDLVDEAASPDRAGRDQRRELRFPGHGLRIELPAACSRVELDLMLFGTGPLKGHALDATGARVWRGETGPEARRPQRLDIRGRGIRVIELFGATEMAALYQLCHEIDKNAPDEPPPDDDDCGKTTRLALSAPYAERAQAMIASGNAIAAVQPTAVVTGIVGTRPRDAWAGEVIEQRRGRDGRGCVLMRFTPRAGVTGPWNGLRIQVPAGKTVTLVSVCGVDQRAADAHASDSAVQASLLNILATVMSLPVEERREIVLAPATEYQLEIGWSWQVWQPEDPNETPPDPDPTAWVAGTTDVLRFAAAPDAGVTPVQQDGINEHVFDARDVGRYLIGVEPANGRATQFTGDPIWVHFETGHVKQLLEQYGRTLAIEIRRTDPKPQSTPAALNAVLEPLVVTLAWLALPDTLQPVGYQLIHAAMAEAPCLPGPGPMGGASVAVTAPLEPEADYDLNVVANKGTDRAVVLATRFRTSRYASPAAMLDALGYGATATGLFLPDDLIVPDGAVLPAGGFVEGDAALDAALAAIDAETLALPEREPKSYVLWRFDAATTSWRIEGLLVDSMEPMKRELTQIVSGVAQAGVRIEPTSAAVGAQTLTLYRANSRWTRVWLKPAVPFTVPATPEPTLRLSFTTPQGTVSGTRRLRSVPSLLEREGL